MTEIVGAEKPSLDDLEHYGVLGMKWGKSRAKASGSQIRSARKRLEKKQNALFDKEDHVDSLPKGSSARQKAEKEFAKQSTDFLKSPDRVTAVRLTRGEKAALLILGGPLGVASIAGTSAVSRRIEKKQDDKVYDKKK